MPIYEKKAEKLRVRKTPAAKRTTYTYPIYDGSTITLIPGKDGIKETAAILGMSSPTVTAHKKRIVEIIKKFFEGANFSG